MDTSAETVKKPKKIKKIIGRFLLVLFTLILAVLVFAVGVIYVFEKGPSEEIRDLFVVTVQQSSAAKPLAKLFLTEEQVAEIMKNNSAQDEDVNSSGELVDIDENIDKDGITIEDVTGPTYKGKMMIVNDPSRVYAFVIPNFNVAKGMKLQDMVSSDGAVGGVNGGGFYDASGLGNGTKPMGIVMSKGEWKSGDKSAYQQVIGFDKDNKLVVGYMTGYDAINRGIRDAIAWGPILIVDGKAVNVGGGGGLNPRTAIGQRADGAVLLLVIDGRQPSSMGASYLDLIGIMQSYGAVNAANLDGGNSTSMVYNGEVVNDPAALAGERCIPTSILVRSGGND